MKDIPRLHPLPVPDLAAYDKARDGGDADFGAFLRISIALTGFSEAELAATGMARSYFDDLGQTLSVAVRHDFLQASLTEEALLASPQHGPVARNLIRLWYLGQWKQLPAEWVAQLPPQQREQFDEFRRNVDRVVSGGAYKEGLAWTAIGASPMGAKQQGFGSWVEPPK